MRTNIRTRQFLLLTLCAFLFMSIITAHVSVYSNSAENVENKVSIPGVKNGVRMTATDTEAGVFFEIEPFSSPYGYRIYRSLDAISEGLTISDFPVMTNTFFDPNVIAGSTYHYTIREIIAPAGFDRNEKTVTGESLSEASEVLTIDVTRQVNAIADNQYGFILMQLGSEIMQVNDIEVEIDPGRGTTPIEYNNRTFVPIRAIIEAMSGTVDWDETEEKATLSAFDTTVTMWIGKTEFLINEEQMEMDIAPMNENDRILLPIRFVAESIGCKIAWIPSSQHIAIAYTLT